MSGACDKRDSKAEGKQAEGQRSEIRTLQPASRVALFPPVSLLTLPAKRNPFFERMVEGLSGLRRCQVRSFQFVVPLCRRIGIVDEHQGRLVAQADRLAFHRLSNLRHENVSEMESMIWEG